MDAELGILDDNRRKGKRMVLDSCESLAVAEKLKELEDFYNKAPCGPGRAGRV